MIRTHRALATAVLLAAAMAGSVQAAVIRVDDDGLDPFECEGAPHRTIQAALAVAQPGDEIRVCPGVYPEQVVLTRTLRLSGVSFGTGIPVIRPAALPESRPSLLSGRPVTAAILVDAPTTRIRDIDVDLSDVTLSACQPILTGIYLRGASGAIERTAVRNVAVAGDPTCNGGVGVYLESGPVAEELGVPVMAPVRASLREVEVAGYQKAGVVVNGPRAVVLVRGGSATGLGSAAGTVPYGYQAGYGARVKFTDIAASAHRSPLAGKAAAGVLLFNTERASINRSSVRDGQEGVLGIGNLLRVKKTEFVNLSADGIVFLGNANLATGNLVDVAGISGVFIRGDRNAVRGGLMRNLPIGVWFQAGIANQYGGVRFEGVAIPAQGVSGGARTDMNEDSAVPFTTE